MVCKHWLNNRCRQGDLCSFLHVYDPSRFPRCHFWETNIAATGKGACEKHRVDECIFKHIEPAVALKQECESFGRGFCTRGSRCEKLCVPCLLVSMNSTSPIRHISISNNRNGWEYTVLFSRVAMMSWRLGVLLSDYAVYLTTWTMPPLHVNPLANFRLGLSTIPMRNDDLRVTIYLLVLGM